MSKYLLKFDGCSKGNPGLAGAGAVLYVSPPCLFPSTSTISPTLSSALLPFVKTYDPSSSSSSPSSPSVECKEIWSSSLFVGEKETNNVAEYTGLIIGLKKSIELGVQDLVVEGDSQLVIKHMKGEYKVNSANLKPYHQEAVKLSKQIPKITWSHIYRDKNKRADELANLAIL